MNRLDKLIELSCPQGVEYIDINSLVRFEQPTKYIVKSTDYSDKYETPVLTAGQSFILGYTNEVDGIYMSSKEHPVIIFDDFTGSYKWVDFSFKVKSSAMKILTAKSERIDLRYLYHIMGKIGYFSDEHKRLWINIYSTFKIPVPPIEVQREIVHILDKFTELTAELAAELTARKKQYEYYREALFDNYEYDEKKLSEVSNIIDSLHSTPCYVNEGISMIRVADVKGGYIDTIKTLKVDKETYEEFIKRYIPQYNDIVISRVGSFGNFSLVPNEKVCLGQNVALIHPLINNKYLYHFLKSNYVANYVQKNARGGGYKNIGIKDILNIPIKVPTMEAQEIIANSLDKFEILNLDLYEGIPAEIEARKKQYEYYRNKLLTFKERTN